MWFEISLVITLNKIWEKLYQEGVFGKLSGQNLDNKLITKRDVTWLLKHFGYSSDSTATSEILQQWKSSLAPPWLLHNHWVADSLTPEVDSKSRPHQPKSSCPHQGQTRLLCTLKLNKTGKGWLAFGPASSYLEECWKVHLFSNLFSLLSHTNWSANYIDSLKHHQQKSHIQWACHLGRVKHFPPLLTAADEKPTTLPAAGRAVGAQNKMCSDSHGHFQEALQ